MERKTLETEELFADGSYILYVNGTFRGDDAIGRWMYDFMCRYPNDMYYEKLAMMMRYDKETMCKAIADMRKKKEKKRKQRPKQKKQAKMQSGEAIVDKSVIF